MKIITQTEVEQMAAQAAGGPAQATPAASGTTTTAAQGAQAQGKYIKALFCSYSFLISSQKKTETNKNYINTQIQGLRV